MLRTISVLAVSLFSAVYFLPVAGSDAAPEYVVEAGKVDKGTYNGYRRFHGTCHACHGQDAMGSSFAPSLVDSLQALSYEEFKATVLEGRQSQSAAGGVNAMPAFANDKNVTKHLDDIYRYLSARAAGVLDPGRPERLPKPK
jgi:mono/diheme cytochrome c family protein